MKEFAQIGAFIVYMLDILLRWLIRGFLLMVSASLVFPDSIHVTIGSVIGATLAFVLISEQLSHTNQQPMYLVRQESDD